MVLPALSCAGRLDEPADAWLRGGSPGAPISGYGLLAPNGKIVGIPAALAAVPSPVPRRNGQPVRPCGKPRHGSLLKFLSVPLLLAGQGSLHCLGHLGEVFVARVVCGPNEKVPHFLG